jgi:hypothetical protein
MTLVIEWQEGAIRRKHRFVGENRMDCIRQWKQSELYGVYILKTEWIR